MNRPKGLALTVVLMGLIYAVAMLWIAFRPVPGSNNLTRFLFFTLVMCVGYVVIWFYWKGRNWARIAVLLVSASSILTLSAWNRVPWPSGFWTTVAHGLLAVRALLGLFLLYYLNTRPLLEFFYRDTKQAGANYGWGRILCGSWIIVNSIRSHMPLIGVRNPSRLATTPPTIATVVTILIGASVVAWGVRAGIVPYHTDDLRS